MNNLFTLNNIRELNRFIHLETEHGDYHMKHIELVKDYAFILNERLGSPYDNYKLEMIALCHDLFKEKGLDPKKTDIKWNDILIPQDTEKYVKENIEVLEKYKLKEFVDSDIQYHSLTAGIWLIKEMDLLDEEILYPIFFHSCPIISLLETLDSKIQGMVELIMLADKLSSNYLRINSFPKEVMIDLDLTVFGKDGREFNYSLGLLMAKLISHKKESGLESQIAINYFHKRLQEINSLTPRNVSPKRLGGKKLWQPRKSKVLKTE